MASGPLGVFPVSSDHGDVHKFHVMRTNGDSLTLDDYRAVFVLITGRWITESEVDTVRYMFAEEDRD